MVRKFMASLSIVQELKDLLDRREKNRSQVGTGPFVGYIR